MVTMESKKQKAESKNIRGDGAFGASIFAFCFLLSAFRHPELP
jgi:hypothetical protein